MVARKFKIAKRTILNGRKVGPCGWGGGGNMPSESLDVKTIFEPYKNTNSKNFILNSKLCVAAVIFVI